jgi:hypothetical protein
MNPTRLFAILIFLAQSFLSSSQPEVNSLGGGGLEVEYITTAPVCAGQSSGSIFVNAEDGVPPYVYDWEDIIGAENPQNRPSVFSGTYFLTVSDASGDTVSLTINVPIVPDIVIDAEIIHESVMGLNDGQINLNISNTQWPWQVEWNTSPVNNSQNLTNLAPGTYCVTVTGANGCLGSDCYIIVDAETTPLVAHSVVQNNYCNGTQNGRIDVDVLLGTPPFIFDWLDLPETNNIKDRLNLSSGIYNLEITDSEGLQVNYSYEIENQFYFDIDFSTSHPTTNLSYDGAISVVNVNGQSPLTYDWVDLIIGYEGKVRSDIQAGLYCVEVTDDDGCFTFECISLIPEFIVSTEIELHNGLPQISIDQLSEGLGLTIDGEIDYLSIYNLMGQRLFHVDKPNSSLFYSVLPGIYYIKYQVQNKETVLKVLVR